MDEGVIGTGAEPEVATATPGGGAVPTGAVPGGADRQPAGPTGHPLVDAALAGLDRVAGAPAAEQVAAYEETHRVLQQTLATIDQA